MAYGAADFLGWMLAALGATLAVLGAQALIRHLRCKLRAADRQIR